MKSAPLRTARSILIPRRLSPEKSCPERSADAKFARWPWRYSVSRYSWWAASICLISSTEGTRTGGRLEKSANPAKGDRGRSESDIERSYSERRRTTPRSLRVRRSCEFATAKVELQPAWRPTAWTGRRRPTRAVPRRGGHAGHLEMAHFLISTRLLKIISSRYAENAKRQENRHFQMSKAISTDMKAGSTVGHRERTCGRVEPSSDETLTRIPLASARTPSRHTASSTSWPRLNRYGLKPQTALAHLPAASSAERPERQKSPFVLVISPRPKQKPSSTRCSTPASITSTPRSITG